MNAKSKGRFPREVEAALTITPTIADDTGSDDSFVPAPPLDTVEHWPSVPAPAVPRATVAARPAQVYGPWRDPDLLAASITQWERAEFTHRVKSRRRENLELNRLCGVVVVHEPVDHNVDAYRVSGLTLSMPERRAAGLALLERERAA